MVNLSGGASVDGQPSNTATAGAVTDTFSGVSTVTGSSAGDTTFLAGPSSDTFTGQGSGNTLDRSAVSGPPSLTVAMAGGPPCGPGAGLVSGPGASPTDCFTNVSTVDGASGKSPDSATPPQPVSGLLVSLNGNSGSSPGEVTATVASTPVTFALFAGVNELIGSPFAHHRLRSRDRDRRDLGQKVPPGAQLARKRKPVLIASGKLSFTSAGTRPLKVKLTSAGKQLLRHSKRVKLSSKGAFTPVGQPSVTVIKTFTLKP